MRELLRAEEKVRSTARAKTEMRMSTLTKKGTKIENMKLKELKKHELDLHEQIRKEEYKIYINDIIKV